MPNYLVTFAASARSTSSPETPWATATPLATASCAIPSEFGGQGGAPSPEDYFLWAITNCFVGTFKVYASASKLRYEAIDVSAELVIDKAPLQSPYATACALNVKVTDAEDPARAVTLLRKVARSGILLNSVKSSLTFNFEVNGEAVSTETTETMASLS